MPKPRAKGRKLSTREVVRMLILAGKNVWTRRSVSPAHIQRKLRRAGIYLFVHGALYDHIEFYSCDGGRLGVRCLPLGEYKRAGMAVARLVDAQRSAIHFLKNALDKHEPDFIRAVNGLRRPRKNVKHIVRACRAASRAERGVR